MEIPTELQQSIKKATQAVEKAQSDYEELFAIVRNLETEYKKELLKKNPTASVIDIHQYLHTALEIDYKNLALEKQNLARKEENLAREKDGKQELLKQQTIKLRIAQDQGISSLITIIPGVAPSQQQSKSLYSSGPVDPKTNYSIPFDMLPWAMDLIQAVDAKQAILLHGHWQSGKTSALRFIKSRAEEQGIKVYYLDMLAEFDALKRFLTDDRSIFQFFAQRISGLHLEYLPDFFSCVEFCIWVKDRQQGNLAKLPILLIDEYDAFLKVGRENPKFLTEMNNLITYNRNIQDTFSSIVCAGTFSIAATQSDDVGDMEVDAEAKKNIVATQADDVGDMEVDAEAKKKSDDSLDAVVRSFNVVSPWNKCLFIETQPFERQVFKDFAASVSESYNTSIDAEVFDDILETTCGHPGFSIWMFIKAIQQAIGRECLKTADWMKERSIYSAELYKTPTMKKMVNRVKSKKIVRALHVLVRDNRVECSEVRLVSFLRAVGIAKPTNKDNVITFTSPIIRDCLLQEFYPAYDNINEFIAIHESSPPGFILSTLLKALPHIKAAEILDPLVTYSKGLAEAAVHAELYRILHAFFRDQSITVLTETRVVTSSDMRCDIWVKTLFAEFVLELKTECDNMYIQNEANPQIVKYASSREPREMVLLNFVRKEEASVTFPMNINPIGWDEYPNTTFSVLFVKVMGDVDSGLKFCYASNGDTCWSEL